MDQPNGRSGSNEDCALPADLVPGRSCPAAYRTDAAQIARAQEISCDVAYVVGGLYGNPFALDAVEKAAARETERGAKVAVVFNGDFHWFDRCPKMFAAVNRRALQHSAVAGNVEIELSSPTPGAGCGCGYPDSIDGAFVERSNAIMRALGETAAPLASERAALAALPRALRLRVGSLTTGVVHGDPGSVAGWAFSVEEWCRVGKRAFCERLARWAQQAEVNLFACAHTCTPLAVVSRKFGCAVINNGSAGMPNFLGGPFGVATRICADSDLASVDRLFATEMDGTLVEAVAVRYAHGRWQDTFEKMWPANSPAAVSYRARIAGQAGSSLVDSYPEQGFVARIPCAREDM